MLVLTRAGEAALLASLLRKVADPGSDGFLEACFVGLFTGTPALTKDSVLGDITECTFNTYARIAFTPGAVFISTDGRTKVKGEQIVFQPTDALKPEVATGIGLFSLVAAGALWGYEMLPGNAPMQKVTDQLVVTPEFAMPNGTSLGEADTET